MIWSVLVGPFACLGVVWEFDRLKVAYSWMRELMLPSLGVGGALLAGVLVWLVWYDRHTVAGPGARGRWDRNDPGWWVWAIATVMALRYEHPRRGDDAIASHADVVLTVYLLGMFVGLVVLALRFPRMMRRWEGRPGSTTPARGR